jgi:hypothetical protein
MSGLLDLSERARGLRLGDFAELGGLDAVEDVGHAIWFIADRGAAKGA